MLVRIHPIAGRTAFLTILTFWLSTVISEWCGSREIIDEVMEEASPWGSVLLVTALAVTAFSGISLAGRWLDRRIAKKRRHMAIIAGNGLLLLLPTAVDLAKLASLADFGASFYDVQAIELVAGTINLALMSLNICDGLS
jgi:hypothetical protein